MNGEGGIDKQRFREEEVAIFEKHGAEVVAVWRRLDNPNRWSGCWPIEIGPTARKSFAADPAWHALRENTRYRCRQSLHDERYRLLE